MFGSLPYSQLRPSVEHVALFDGSVLGHGELPPSSIGPPSLFVTTPPQATAKNKTSPKTADLFMISRWCKVQAAVASPILANFSRLRAKLCRAATLGSCLILRP
jgi:hypothetical protein